ncbi:MULTISPECIES: YggS family pyridoxal phosphate-dependent enzyme [unclassified Paenibacillus]|uniref:YggS family pyridoxal phosphate-dependent enzyme n=1 Tax=unclassified Paenibacillus TaxID=185978 RepID=UPI001C121DDE|nr:MULTISPECIES: YggS family pyridoxal phosphate-dependent enzyme [unclassified Paenibacillus]MBU5440534.1 YggS family pyridoxal phosphate-dependent enzyme [Paenibacillus sp. MSJ-34]CAH0122510.1 Pyridoxal phosphate homeostasis protein [Paenibacillus sp. CECT 9249]
MTLQQRMELVEERVKAACARSGRKRDEVEMIAVTKYVSLEKTASVLRHGLLHIGENRWQDAEAKWNALGDQGTWHFLGHLQTNKVKNVIGKFAYIHSLDRLSLAQELDKKAAAADLNIRCFIQVNVSGEESKYGLEPEQLIPFVKALHSMPRLQVVGLMTMAPLTNEAEQTRPVFRGLRTLRDELNKLSITEQPIPHLSMGMSGDFEVAVEEGATWIRLGSILVGKEEEV